MESWFYECEPGYVLEYEPVSRTVPYQADFGCWLHEPTTEQAIEWSPNTRSYAQDCHARGGTFEAFNFVHQGGGAWKWSNRCHPPASVHEREGILSGVSNDALLSCGVGVVSAYLGDWLGLLSCLGLFQ